MNESKLRESQQTLIGEDQKGGDSHIKKLICKKMHLARLSEWRYWGCDLRETLKFAVIMELKCNEDADFSVSRLIKH